MFGGVEEEEWHDSVAVCKCSLGTVTEGNVYAIHTLKLKEAFFSTKDVKDSGCDYLTILSKYLD